ncbi:MAG: UDP-glucose 4-epimerase GalE [Actinomycetes bacterium]|nr:UDP-glucose 4-epimerase GalE [Actinomycetes bacterium]
MKVLVVGGAGYIGSHMVYDLLRANHEVIVADNLSTGRRSDVHPDAAFVQLDIRDRAALDKLFATHPGIDLVMHFAAKLIVPESVQHPLTYYSNNVDGVRVLVESMLAAGVNTLVFSSTAAVYGEPTLTRPLREDDPLAPINPYGATKRAAEELIAAAGAAHGLNYAILRYFNAAGADSSGDLGLNKPHLTHLIPLATRAALGMGPALTVYGTDWPTPDGTCIRDYIHVSDLTAAHLLAAEHLMDAGGSLTLNLGTNTGSSVLQVIDAVGTYSPCPYVTGPRRAGDPAQLVADSTRARSVLGWEPVRSLDDIVRSDFYYRKYHSA